MKQHAALLCIQEESFGRTTPFFFMEYGVLQELALLPFARIQGVFGCCTRLSAVTQAG